MKDGAGIHGEWNYFDGEKGQLFALGLYIPHVRGGGEEAKSLKNNPTKKARRWVVEVAHSWFNRFRKLLVRYEKLERSFMALNHLAAAIIAFRKIKDSINIIYG